MRRGEGRRSELRSSVMVLVATAVAGALVLGGCLALLGATTRAIRNLGPDLDFDIPGPFATEEELAIAATTTPPRPSDCRALDRLAASSAALAAVNFDRELRAGDFPVYRARLVFALAAFDRDLAAAVAVSEGPLRDHLAQVRTSVRDARGALETAQLTRDYEPFSYAERGYLELAIADDLLGDTCGGRLTPPDPLDLLIGSTTQPVSGGSPGGRIS